jgi:hypothetical protein
VHELWGSMLFMYVTVGHRGRQRRGEGWLDNEWDQRRRDVVEGGETKGEQ